MKCDCHYILVLQKKALCHVSTQTQSFVSIINISNNILIIRAKNLSLSLSCPTKKFPPHMYPFFPRMCLPNDQTRRKPETARQTTTHTYSCRKPDINTNKIRHVFRQKGAMNSGPLHSAYRTVVHCRLVLGQLRTILPIAGVTERFQLVVVRAPIAVPGALHLHGDAGDRRGVCGMSA